MNEFNVVACSFIVFYGLFGFLIYVWMLILISKKTKKSWTPSQSVFVMGAYVSIPVYVLTFITKRIPEFTERTDFFSDFFMDHGPIVTPFNQEHDFLRLLYIVQIVLACSQQFFIAVLLISYAVETLGLNMNVEFWKEVFKRMFGVLILSSIAATLPLWWSPMYFEYNMTWDTYSLVPRFMNVHPKLILFRRLVMTIYSICILIIVLNVVRRNIGENVYKPELLFVLTPITVGFVGIIQLAMENHCSELTYIPHKLRSMTDLWMYLHTPVVLHVSILFLPYLWFLADREMRKECWKLIKCPESKRQSTPNPEMCYDIELAEFVPVESAQ